MDNIYETDEIKSDFESEYGNKTITVECVIDTIDKGGISKLLSVSAKVRSTSVEPCDEGIKAFNQVNYIIMYVDNDGMEQCVDYLSDFNYTFPKTEGFNNKYFRCDACVMDIDSEVVGNSVKLQTVVDIKLFGIKTAVCQCVKVDDEGILKKCKDISIQTYVCDIKEHFGVVEDYESGGSINKILCFDSNAIIKKANVINDKIAISGEIVATVSYICDNSLTNKSFNIPFSEEVKILNVESGCDNLKVNLFADIADRKIILSGSADNNIMCLQFNLCVNGSVYNEESKQIVSDMYSSTQELALEYCHSKGYCFESVAQISDKIYGSAMIKDDMVAGRKIVSTNIARNCITKISYDNGRITVDGVLACNVIYENIDTDICAILVEVPYSVETDKEGLNEDYRFTADSVAELMTTKIKGDREIEVSAMLCVMVNIHKPTHIECVSSMKIGATKNSENYAITIYAPASGEDLWEIAKNINAPMEEIMKQNPSLKDGECKRIVFYRQMS